MKEKILNKIEESKTYKSENNKKKINKKNNLLYKLIIEKTNNTIIQFIRYIFVGGVAAIVNIGGLFILSEKFHIYYLLANIIAFTLGLIINYTLSKLIVFSKENSINKFMEFIIYAVIGSVGLGIDTFLMWIFTDKINLYFMMSKIITTGIVFVWNFGARKYLYVFINNIKNNKKGVM